MLEKARNEIEQFYTKDQDGYIPVGYIWARTILCQNPICGAEIPLIKKFWLCNKKNKKIAYKPIVNKENKKVDFDPEKGTHTPLACLAPYGARSVLRTDAVSRANARCPVCEQVTPAVQVRQLIVVVLHHPNKSGKKYRIAKEQDIKTFELAEKYLEEKVATWRWLESPLPNEKLPPIGTLGYR